jgi:hypothetical protein
MLKPKKLEIRKNVEIVKDPIKTKQSVINEVYGKNHDPI